MIVNSRVMANTQSLDLLSVLNDVVEQHQILHPETHLSIDRPIQEVGILGVADNNNDLMGQVEFTDQHDVQHTLYFQEARAEQQLPLHLLQIGLILFYMTVALGLPWVLRGRTPTKRVATQQVQSDQKTSDAFPKTENDGLPFGVVILDSSGSVEYANTEATRMLNLSPNLLLGSSAQRLESLLNIPGAGKQTLSVLERGQNKGYVVEVLQQQQPQQVFVSISRIGTSPPRALMMLQDRSDYRRLSAKTNLLQQVLDALPCAIIAIDRRNRVIALNDTAAIIFDVDKFKCLGRLLASSLAQMLPSLANHEEAVGLKLRLGDGADDAQYDIRTRHLRDFHGRMQGTVCIISDKSTELSLAEQVKRNERLAVIGQMAAGTVHEIRNPLAAVRGFAQLLAQGSEGGKAREYSELTMLEIDRIDQIFSEFLLLSRAVEPDMVPVELSSVLQDVLQLLQALFEQKHIRLHIDRWQAAQVLGDAHYLQHVFLHLLYNALDATHAGGSISIELARLGEVVSVTITDTGKGMDEEALNSCFDPFFTTKETGTGLGLTICQRLLDQMNGFIKIESLPGAGTTVLLSFPLAMENTD